MTLPHTYTDEADHTLKVTARPGPRLVTKTLLPTEDEQGVIEHVASVTAPKGEDAVALAKAILEAAGDTGHVVIPQGEIDQLRTERDRARRARNRYQDERNDERQRAALLRVASHAAKSAIPDAPERGTPLTADTDA